MIVIRDLLRSRLLFRRCRGYGVYIALNSR